MAQCFTCKSDVSQSETSDLQGSRVVPCGQTDGFDKANCRVFFFSNGPKKPLTQLTPVLFVVGTHLDTNGSPTGYHSVTLKKKDIQWHFLLTFWHWSFTFKF